MDIINAQGIALPLVPAGPLVRAYAWLIDLLWRVLFYGLFLLLINLLNLPVAGFMLIALFLMEWAYPVVFEVWFGGMTPGKKSMGIRVVEASGAQIGLGASMIRNLLRVVDSLPLLYATGLIAMLADRQFRRLGDRVAQTWVIYHEPVQRIPSPAQPTVLPHQQPYPWTAKLDAVQIQAIKAFAERRTRMTVERQQELAEVLSDWLPQEMDTAEALEQLSRQLRYQP